MINKILVEVYVPTIEEKYDIFIPINKTIEVALILINQGIYEMTNGMYAKRKNSMLCNKDTGIMYDLNTLVKDSDLKHGSRLLLI